MSVLKIHLVCVTKYRRKIFTHDSLELIYKSLWIPSYFVSSVGGAPLEVLKKYIQNQEKPSQNDGVFNPFLR
ncbi:transposase [Chrysosporum bergii ANA360D]|uniref:Transposase n=1 Tax=Chrysosporum bergii ANA360D TaxID=617107 RepID=A0AA43KBF2_9CYAN|nr:transposase [Chrysosporum bergii]MDH6059865.1 transposase [Chrysosporum bergii ANA360D]